MADQVYQRGLFRFVVYKNKKADTQNVKPYLMSLLLVLIVSPIKGVVKRSASGYLKKAGVLASTLALLGFIGRSQVFIHTVLGDRAVILEHVESRP